MGERPERVPAIQRLLSLCGFAALLLLTMVSGQVASANDDIFPPADAAKPYVNFDGKGFLIHGQRTFLASGSFHFARCPRALWRDRLLRMKRMGLNTVQTYIFWNWHEAKEDQWDFTGDHDLGAFLRLAHELGMYATVRLGPYDCAEWDSGGYPVWLRFKPGVRVREDNPQFLHYVDQLYDKIVPIVAANQINRGGSVILVQCENEYGGGWGTEGNAYEQHLRSKALSLGIEVPTFFSGLHHSSDPAGNAPWDSAGRTSPWYSTEFWTTWYDAYGAIPEDRLDGFTRATWKIIAYGGNGYNYYMGYGGTNFGYTNNNEDASSYDYGTMIGQAGDLRPMYYRFKRAAWFARSFPDVLEDSVSDAPKFQDRVTNPDVRVLARTSPAGTIVFLDNTSDHPVQTQIKDAQGIAQPAAGPVTLEKGEILPVMENYKLTPQFMIDQSVTRILATVKNGHDTTLVVYGAPGEAGALEISSPSKITSTLGTVNADGHHASMMFNYPHDQPQSLILNAGGERLQILVMSGETADHAWPVEIAGKTDLIVGPDYIGEANTVDGTLRVQAEYKNAPSLVHLPVTVYAPGLTSYELKPVAAMQSAALPDPPTLTDWRQSTVQEQSPSYGSKSWLASPDVLPMGADGDTSAYAWYKTTVMADNAGIYHLNPATLRDHMIVFVDGRRVAANAADVATASLDLTAGTHQVSILTTHYGRDKLFGYGGPIDTVDAKGLSGDVFLTDTAPQSLTAWQNLPATQVKPDATTAPVPDAADWQPIKLGSDPFNKKPGWDWYQTIVPATASASGTHVLARFDSVDDNATVYCNGAQVGTHQGWNTAFTVDLSRVWKPNQQNIVTVLDENTDGAGGISGTVTLTILGDHSTITDWRMRGGIGEPVSVTDWTPLSDGGADAPPTWFQAKFTASAPSSDGPHPIRRVHLGGMSAGFVWLNGHNLGRYPEKIAVDGLYLPECWILPGANTLTIFDEDGHQPADVRLINEQAASRFMLRFAANAGG